MYFFLIAEFVFVNILIYSICLFHYSVCSEGIFPAAFVLQVKLPTDLSFLFLFFSCNFFHLFPSYQITSLEACSIDYDQQYHFVVKLYFDFVLFSSVFLSINLFRFQSILDFKLLFFSFSVYQVKGLNWRSSNLGVKKKILDHFQATE